MITFIWERNGQELNIDPNLKYLVYYRGCFCPPHNGHFEAASKYLGHPNVRMIIHQMGGYRHGVSKSTNRKIWQTYIEELFPNEKIHLVQYDEETSDYPKYHPWLKKSDVLVIIRGDEYNDIESREQEDMYQWDSTIMRCKRNGIDVIFAYDTRDAARMSASTFVEDINRYKRDRIKIESLYKYLPEKLSIRSKKHVINLLIRHDLR